MRFDLHLRGAVRAQVSALAGRMAEWDHRTDLQDTDRRQILESIHSFSHTTSAVDLVVAGVDGSGDFPALSYADSFVYLSTAAAVVYRSDPSSGLREPKILEPLVEFTWLPEDEQQRGANLIVSFERMAGRTVPEVVEGSDYLALKAGRGGSTKGAVSGLILPHASDAGNLAIQLRSVAELSAALRALPHIAPGGLLLMDGTLSLPFVSRSANSLFHEHLKRLLCVEARGAGIGTLWVSKSAGLSGEGILEELAREKLGVDRRPDHWFIRLSPGEDFPLLAGKRVPPAGAVSYLVRTHTNVPILRVDMDEYWWRERVQGASPAETLKAERRLLGQLDFVGHDQRSYGYPYPIKAAHDRSSLTKVERLALRKQLIDAAVLSGMRRTLFRDASTLTGHR